MAGAFGGDYNQYEDEDELDENPDSLDDEFDEEYEDEEEYDDEDEEDEDSDEISEENQKQLKEAEKKSIDNQLKKIRKTAPYRFYPHYTMSERRVIAKAKKTNPQQVKKLDELMAQRKEAFRAKVKSVVGPILPPVLIFLLIMLVAILVVGIIAYIISSLFGGGSDGEKPSMSAQFGVNGQDFYGCRVVYSDEEQSQIEMIENYINSIRDSIESAENSTLDITIDLPAEDYDFTNFDESEFAEAYGNAYNLLDLMVDEVYSTDTSVSDGETTDDSTLSLMEKIDGIEYFGFDSELASAISAIISTYINDNDLYQILDDSGDTANIEQDIVNSINIYFNGLDNIRTEKLFIKDFIFEDSDDMMSGITEKNYVALIFMPKRQVEFSYFSFMIGNADFDNINLYIQNGEQIIDLNGQVWTTENEGGETYLFESDNNLNLSTNQFSDIDLNNINYLTNGLSLIDIVNGEIDYNIYLEVQTSEDSKTYLTWKDDGIIVRFESVEPFVFVEFETDWE